MNKLEITQLKNSQLLQELIQRIKDKRIRFTHKLTQCISGFLSWDDSDKYWLDLSELDKVGSHYSKTHWHCHSQPEEKEEEKIIMNCQECQAPIKMSPPDQKGRKVLEFYGKWTGKGHNLVCQNCLEKK